MIILQYCDFMRKISFLLLFIQCFGDLQGTSDESIRKLEKDVDSFKKDGYPHSSLSEEDLAEILITNLKTHNVLNWTEFKMEVENYVAQSFLIIMPGIKLLSTLQSIGNISENKYIISRLNPFIRNHYYIDASNLYNDSMYKALTIYKNLAEHLGEALPDNITDFYLFGEGVSALTLVALTNKIIVKEHIPFIFLDAFNPLLLEFHTNDYNHIQTLDATFIFTNAQLLSTTELNILQAMHLIERVWIFESTLDCMDTLCSYRKAFTIYAMTLKQKLKNYKICRVNDNKCSLQPLNTNYVFQVKKLQSTSATDFYADEDKDSDIFYRNRTKYINQFINEGFPAKEVTDDDLDKVSITNIRTNRIMNWKDFEDELKNSRPNFTTIIVPSIKKISTLQSKGHLWENKYIESLSSLSGSQYYIDTANLYNDSTYVALKIYKGFGEKLSDILPAEIDGFYLIGEGVSGLTLANVGNNLTLKNPKSRVILTVFNPVLLNFLTSDYNFSNIFLTEFIIGDKALISDSELKTLQSMEQLKVWLFVNRTDDNNTINYARKTSNLLMMVRRNELASYEICRLNGSECLNFGNVRSLGVFEFTKLVRKEDIIVNYSIYNESKADIFVNKLKTDLTKFVKEGFQQINLTEDELSKLNITNLGTGSQISWISFKENLKKCSQRDFIIFIPGNEIDSTLGGEFNDYVSALSTIGKCQYYINTKDLYNNSMYDSLTIYKSFGKALFHILPENITRIHLIGEGVSALSLAVTAQELKARTSLPASSFTVFNPILSNFTMDLYSSFDNFLTGFIISDMKSLSIEELDSLKTQKSLKEVWLFNNTFDCKDVLCSRKEASKMFLMMILGILQDYEICNRLNQKCSPLLLFDTLDFGIFRFQRIKSESGITLHP